MASSRMGGLDDLKAKRRDLAPDASLTSQHMHPVDTNLDQEGLNMKRVLETETPDRIDTVSQTSLSPDPDELSRSLEKSENELNAELITAVGNNDFPRVRKLLEDGASVNARELPGRTVLMRACLSKNKAIVGFLLERGAAVNETSTLEGETALMFSVKEGDENTFMLLLDHRANITQKNNFGWNVVHFAAMYNQKSILERLLSPSLFCEHWGFSVDIDDDAGRTPLWLAVYYDHAECVDVLLAHGANPDHESKILESPLDIAKRCGLKSIVCMMTEALESASSRQHYLRVIKSVVKTTENIRRWEERICEREKEIQELEKLKREFQGTSKVSEQKKARAKSCSQQSVGSCDAEILLQAVVSCGGERWYSIGIALGFSSCEMDVMTSGVPDNADKIRVVFNRTINHIGKKAAAKRLLEACRCIPHPIIDAVMDSLLKIP